MDLEILWETLWLGIGITIIVILTIFVTIGFTIKKDFSFKFKLINPVTEPPNTLLEKILRDEIINKPKGLWNCLDYATYYNKTISEKYPKLDVRFPRNMDICNNLTLCDSYHTFLVIAGYGAECILDQRSLVCVDVVRTNKTIKEIDNMTW